MALGFGDGVEVGADFEIELLGRFGAEIFQIVSFADFSGCDDVGRFRFCVADC